MSARPVPLIDLQAQHAAIRDVVMPAVQAVIERQQFIMGPEVRDLESAIARLSRVPHGIGCASGTDALLLPLRALDLRPGDEVITPAFTMGATATAVHNAGGTPVFVDVDRASFNVTPDAIEVAMTPRTRAIIVVHLFGQMAPMEEILNLAERKSVPVLEDAAQAIGAQRNFGGRGGAWRRAGETGWAASLSFFPTKNLGCWGDGGMILTRDDGLAERLRRLRVHGGLRKYFHEEVGTNSRLDTIQAAVLLAKLPFLEAWSAARRRHAEWYTDRFSAQGDVTPPWVDPANEPIFHQYTIRAPRRDELLQHLTARGIGCAVYYPLALHLQPCFAHLGHRPGSLPEAEAATREVLSLPVYPELTDAQREAVASAVLEFYGGKGVGGGRKA